MEVRKTGCHGFCERGTLVVIYPEEICYTHVKPDDVPEVVQSTRDKKVVDRLLYDDPVTYQKIVKESEIPFYKHQKDWYLDQIDGLTQQVSRIICTAKGIAPWLKFFSQVSPEEVIEEVKKSKLRGRGGAGFPTGRKWETTKKAFGNIKYVIVNCDEGDPGAYMDRSLMEGNPHSVLEGLIIGAYAIGSHRGYIYVREEYPLAVNNVNIAIKQAEEYGFLGRTSLVQALIFLLKCTEERELLSLESQVR